MYTSSHPLLIYLISQAIMIPIPQLEMNFWSWRWSDAFSQKRVIDKAYHLNLEGNGTAVIPSLLTPLCVWLSFWTLIASSTRWIRHLQIRSSFSIVFASSLSSLLSSSYFDIYLLKRLSISLNVCLSASVFAKLGSFVSIYSYFLFLSFSAFFDFGAGILFLSFSSSSSTSRCLFLSFSFHTLLPNPSSTPSLTPPLPPPYLTLSFYFSVSLSFSLLSYLPP